MENLLFDLKDLKLETITRIDGRIIINTAMTATAAACLDCRQPSTRIHSRYQRTLADLPCGGQETILQIQVRRFFCLNQKCPRRLFAEQVPSVMKRYARRTLRQERALETIGLALGGEAGRRTAGKLGIHVSADTLLRRVRSIPDSGEKSVRVLGVDDFAFRRGHRYGTILVDQEAHRPIELLPNREAATLRTWLQGHPEVEIITRDRSLAYAEAARSGAPQAVQVADRFHVLQNLREAVERTLVKRHPVLRQAAQEISPRYQTEQMLKAEGLIESISDRVAPVDQKAQALSQQRRARRLARYEEVNQLKQQGLTIRQIARQLGAHRRTIRNFLRAESFPERQAPKRRATLMDPFVVYLKKRWEEGCHNGAQLYREIRRQGYKGGATALRRHLRKWRGAVPEVIRKLHLLSDFPTPSPRQASWWLCLDEDRLEKQEREYVDALTRLSSEIQTVRELTKEFQQLVKQRQEAAFDQWRERVAQSGLSELKSFAEGLMSDEAAVREALRSKWSSGQTEGQINRLKMLKRQMYGRGKIDLLRSRVLNAA
jgi:transposase